MQASPRESESLSKPKSGRRAETYLPSGFLTAAARTLDYFTAGVCWQILHLMHESTERGKLLVNGRPMLHEELGRILGLRVGDRRRVRIPNDKLRGKLSVNLESVLEKLIAAGIIERDATTAALICREMIKKHKMHQERVEKGRLGGNPDLLKLQKEKHLADLNRIVEKAAEENPLVNHVIDLEPRQEPQRSYVDEANEIFDFWQFELKKVNAKFSKIRRQKVFARLCEGYTVEQIKHAITGCKKSPRHQGDNESGEKVDELSLICANRSQLERFIEMHNVAEDYQRPIHRSAEGRERNLKQILAQVADVSETKNKDEDSQQAKIPRRDHGIVRDKYWGTVGRLVMMRAASYLHRLDMSTREYEFITDTWTEALRDVVPLDQVRNAYKRAVEDHEGQSPVTVSEMIQAYRKMTH